MKEVRPHRIPRSGLILYSAVFGLLTFVVACSGSGDGSASDAYGESDPQVVTANSFTVEMKGIKFVPQGISVLPGTTVTWVNNDPVVHNVRQVESEFLSPDSMAPGQSFSYTFTRAGTFRYQCTFHHPTMNGVVIVGQR